ncbi:hypothetical protein Tdes44962_MAKER00249 [Teratosphaeria destructans]|uniref:Uncharacterized protein n=1 Tax=Teratosphaeria destructans TaxID=418781 RepID=A0A9W7SV57_9PEZI|nr:hypothetical protein Tdes44962_MAKER00249 [Teratosphaeria destructans]
MHSDKLISLPLLVVAAVVLISPFAATMPTAIAVRPTGAVGEHFDAAELVKRISLKAATKILLAFTLTALVCYSPAAVATPVGWACAVLAIYSMAMVISGKFRNAGTTAAPAAGRRDVEELFTSMHTHHYASIDSMSTITQLVGNYTGGEPIKAMSCNNPGAANCFDAYYSNHLHSDNVTTVHNLSLRPGGWSASNTASNVRRSQTPTEGESSGDAADGTPVFGMHAPVVPKSPNTDIAVGNYVWYDESTSDETAMGYDGGFPMDLADVVAKDANFKDPGYVCLNLIDVTANSLATVGYVSVQQDEAAEDPDNELSYLSTCKGLTSSGYIG